MSEKNDDEPAKQNKGLFCNGCLYDDDPCHYLCQECEDGKNREQHPGYCIHGIIREEDCKDCEIERLRAELESHERWGELVMRRLETADSIIGAPGCSTCKGCYRSRAYCIQHGEDYPGCFQPDAPALTIHHGTGCQCDQCQLLVRKTTTTVGK